MTTASLHREMVEALQAVAFEYINGDLHLTANGARCCGTCLTTVERCDRWNARDPERRCHGPSARAALEGWEKRAPLGQTPAVLGILADLVTGKHSVGETADRLDTLLYGERG